MSNLDKINFKNYLNDNIDADIQTDIFNIHEFDDHSEINILTNNELKKLKENKNLINNFKECYINETIYKLDNIGESYKKINHLFQYYINYLKNSIELMNSNCNDDIKNLLNRSIENLYKVLILELNNNKYLVNNNLEYVMIEKLHIYLIPKIEFILNNYKLNIKITEKNKIYNFVINKFSNDEYIDYTYISQSIINIIKDINSYFNTRYNLLSSIINQLKIKIE